MTLDIAKKTTGRICVGTQYYLIQKLRNMYPYDYNVTLIAIFIRLYCYIEYTKISVSRS